MRPAVRAAFYAVNKPWEGEAPFLYLDVLGLVTCGVGNLVDPMATALDLPMFRQDGSPASREDIAHAWRAVKARTDLAQRGGGAFRDVTTLRLRPEGIKQLVGAKLSQMGAALAARFARWTEMPADAQMALCCLSWAIGPGFRWPRLEAAIARADCAAAADECVISADGNPGVRPRNDGMRTMLLNAAHVVTQGLDPETLFYPLSLSTEGAQTLPMLVDPPSEPTLEEDGGVSRWMATRRDVTGHQEE